MVAKCVHIANNAFPRFIEMSVARVVRETSTGEEAVGNDPPQDRSQFLRKFFELELRRQQRLRTFGLLEGQPFSFFKRIAGHCSELQCCSKFRAAIPLLHDKPPALLVAERSILPRLRAAITAIMAMQAGEAARRAA
jgi:hypothetical protein